MAPDVSGLLSQNLGRCSILTLEMLDLMVSLPYEDSMMLVGSITLVQHLLPDLERFRRRRCL
jgi:hypothetical protein